MDFITGFFIGSTFWFWAFILIEIGVLMYCIESERAIMSVMSIVLLAVIFKVLMGISIFGYFVDHILLAPLWVLAYLAIGALYSTGRWWLKGWKWRRRYDRVTTEEQKEESGNYIPVLSKNKGRVIMWMAYWPISALHWALYDMLHEVYASLYHKMVKFYLAITRSHLKGTIHETKEVK